MIVKVVRLYSYVEVLLGGFYVDPLRFPTEGLLKKPLRVLDPTFLLRGDNNLKRFTVQFYFKGSLMVL